jgi:hypothetical protein
MRPGILPGDTHDRPADIGSQDNEFKAGAENGYTLAGLGIIMKIGAGVVLVGSLAMYFSRRANVGKSPFGKE